MHVVGDSGRPANTSEYVRSANALRTYDSTMQIDVLQLLHANPALVLFLLIGLGYLLGNISVCGFSVGPTAGVLVAGLGLGHIGLAIPDNIETIGFILFMYSVGLQAGPRFFSVFLEDGLKYAVLAFVVCATAVATTLFFTWLFGFRSGLPAGLLAGALSSSPTLAAAQDAVLHHMPAELQPTMSNNVGVGYAITYLFGLVGLMGFVHVMPRLLRLDLPQEAKELAQRRRMPKDVDTEQDSMETSPRLRAFEVANPEILGRPLQDLHFTAETGCVIQQIKRGDTLLTPDATTRLQPGDRVSVAGTLESLEPLAERIGPGVFDPDLLRPGIATAVVVVDHPDAVGRAIGELHTVAKHASFIVRLIRAQIELPVSMDIVLEKGDVVFVAGEQSRLKALIASLGHVERDVVQTDLLTFAFGIAAGIGLGQISVKIGALSLGLGTAGGLLVSGIAIGFLRSIHPTFGRVPPAVRWIFLELGLLFFMAGIGLKAGRGIVASLSEVGLPLFASGVLVTLARVIVGYLVGRLVLRIPPALLFGAIAGAMTSTPTLNVVTRAANSPLPALGYAGTYTFANVFMALSGTLLILL